MPADETVLVGRYSALKARRQQLSAFISSKENQIEELEHNGEVLLKCRQLFLEVARITQTAFKEKVESLQTLAIQSVFNRPFEFELRFQQSYNNATCIPIIKEGDSEYIPKDDMGGGIIDLVSITLRFILWSLSNPQTRKVFILDEPLKFVGKGILLQKAGQMLRELSHRMGFQLIIVTHEDELAEIADKAYHVKHDGFKSIVQQVHTALVETTRTVKRTLKRRKPQ